ncbi:MAG: outer membrane beta-barrel protein [bacterium]|nr:outer membrane beta-barrel protein [bacterium]
MTPTRPAQHPPVRHLLPTLAGLFTLALFAGVALSAGDALADDHEEEGTLWYFEFQTGVAHVPNQSIDAGSAATGLGSVQPDEVGVHFGGALGRKITDLFRAEIAITHREADIDQAGLVSGTQADGDLSLFAVMANGYVDLDLGDDFFGITPWIGAGIGGGSYKIDVYQTTDGAFEIDDGDPVFVYNAMAGVIVPVSDVVAFNFGYRYIAIAGEKGSGAVIAPSTRTQEVEDEFDAHEGIIGIRFNF